MTFVPHELPQMANAALEQWKASDDGFSHSRTLRCLCENLDNQMPLGTASYWTEAPEPQTPVLLDDPDGCYHSAELGIVVHRFGEGERTCRCGEQSMEPADYMRNKNGKPTLTVLRGSKR